MGYFVSPKIIFGEDSLSSLEEINCKRILIVTDHNLVQLGIADRVTGLLSKRGVDTLVFDQVDPDPTLASVEMGVKAANSFNPDWIIGLGGGSPMDAEKAIWVLCPILTLCLWAPTRNMVGIRIPVCLPGRP